MQSMLETALGAFTASIASLAVLAGEGTARSIFRLACYLCNFGSGYGDGLPGGGPGLGGPFAGGPEEEDEEPDPCEGQRRGVAMAEGFVDTVQNQINYYKEQIQKLGPPMQDLLSKMEQLAPQAQEEVLWYLLDQLLGKFKDVLLAQVPLGNTGVALGDAVDWMTGSDPTGSMAEESFGENYDAGIGDIIGFFSEMNDYYTLMAGSWEDLGRMAEREGMPKIKEFVDTMMDLKKLMDRGKELGNNISQKEEELADKKRKLEEAQAELAACMAGSAAA